MNYQAIEKDKTIKYQVQKITDGEWAPANGVLFDTAEEAFALEELLQEKTDRVHRVVRLTHTIELVLKATLGE